MTCIVAIVQDGKVWMGADSAASNSSWHLRTRNDQKLFRKGEMLFGFTSSYRMGQLLRYCFSPPPFEGQRDPMEYLCGPFIDELLKCFEDKKYAAIKDNVARGGCFLVGWRGQIYRIEEDFQVAQAADPFDSVGCGDVYALGALAAIEDAKMSARKKLIRALEVAERYSAGVRRPFHVLSMQFEAKGKRNV